MKRARPAGGVDRPSMTIASLQARTQAGIDQAWKNFRAPS